MAGMALRRQTEGLKAGNEEEEDNADGAKRGHDDDVGGRDEEEEYEDGCREHNRNILEIVDRFCFRFKSFPIYGFFIYFF